VGLPLRGCDAHLGRPPASGCRLLACQADFSEQDRKDLLDEIKDHVAQTQRYYKMHLTYNQNLHNGLQ